MQQSGTTNVNLIGVMFILLMSILIVSLPRRWAIIPIIMTACFMTMEQVVNIAGLNFYMIRIILLVGWVRVILRREMSYVKLNTIDKLIICWVASGVVIYNLQWQTYKAFVYRSSFAYMAIGSYFLFRFFLRDFEDMVRVFKMLVIAASPLAVEMLIEVSTGYNVFSIFGGLSEYVIRDGKFRCFGAFAHPISAGTFGATLVPFFIALWFNKEGTKLLPIIGLISAMVIIITSTSSGPLMTLAAAIIGFLIWPFRQHMRAIRWALLLGVVGLHMIMKAPVWFLFSRVKGLTGGHGWYRSALIDQTIAHFSDWWLLGTKYTAHWMPTGVSNNPDRADLINHFVVMAVDGGLLTLILFVSIIAFSFKAVGQALWKSHEEPFFTKITIWSMGVALFAHSVSLLSVAYFDQLIVFWYLLLAMISSISSFVYRKNAEGPQFV